MFKKYILLSAVMAFLLCSCTERARYVAVTGFAQGGTYSVKFNISGVKESRERISSAIDSILTLVDTTLSGYNKSSLLSRFNSGETVVPNDLFCEIYSFCSDIYEETGGCVDVASGPLFDIWGFGFSTDSLPSDDLVKETLATCGSARLPRALISGVPVAGSELASGNRATLGIVRGGTLQGGAERSEALSGGKTPAGNRATLNFNAVAQGYTCDLVAAYLHSIGVKDMLVDIGEIYCEGVNPAGQGWSIGIDRPVDGNETPGADLDGIWTSEGRACGIVTSGNYRKFYVRDGKKYAHTIDPRTGYPVQHNLLSATVTATSGAAADAYATYCMVIGLEEAKAFIESRDDLEAYLIYDTGNGMEEWASHGFALRSTATSR